MHVARPTIRIRFLLNFVSKPARVTVSCTSVISSDFMLELCTFGIFMGTSLKRWARKQGHIFALLCVRIGRSVVYLYFQFIYKYRMGTFIGALLFLPLFWLCIFQWMKKTRLATDLKHFRFWNLKLFLKMFLCDKITPSNQATISNKTTSKFLSCRLKTDSF